MFILLKTSGQKYCFLISQLSWDVLHLCLKTEQTMIGIDIHNYEVTMATSLESFKICTTY